MVKEKIDRINYLAAEKKLRDLTPEELEEQAALRQEYLAEIRASLGATLGNTVIERPDGTREQLKKKN
ncbi:MAG: DUF896 domain-containing protein [Ruminococcaceae bacterium]|nr:DUF896 domain-containing protein [Oscillospiraceae bacterium]